MIFEYLFLEHKIVQITYYNLKNDIPTIKADILDYD